MQRYAPARQSSSDLFTASIPVPFACGSDAGKRQADDLVDQYRLAALNSVHLLVFEQRRRQAAECPTGNGLLTGSPRLSKKMQVVVQKTTQGFSLERLINHLLMRLRLWPTFFLTAL